MMINPLFLFVVHMCLNMAVYWMNRYCSDFPQESSCPGIAAIPASCSLQVDHIPTTWTLQVMYTDPVGPNFEFSPMLAVLPRFPRIDQTPPMLVVLPRFPRIDSILPNNLILIIWLYVWIWGGGSMLRLTYASCSTSLPLNVYPLVVLTSNCLSLIPFGNPPNFKNYIISW